MSSVLIEDDTPTVTLTIMVGSGGGFVVYDVSNNASKLAFGGNLDETTSYIHSVMDSLRAAPGVGVEVKPTTMSPAAAYSSQAFRKSFAKPVPRALADTLDPLNEEI